MAQYNPWQVRNDDLMRRVQEEIGQAISRNLTGRFVPEGTVTGRFTPEAPKKLRVRIKKANEVQVSDADLNAYNAVKSIVDDGKEPVAATKAAEEEFTAEELETFKSVGRRLAAAARRRLVGQGGSVFTGVSVESDGELRILKETIKAGAENVAKSEFRIEGLLEWLNATQQTPDEIYRSLINRERPRVVKGCDCPMCRDICERNGIPASFDFARYR